MDVTCERCGTEYEFDETLLSGRGTSVKCTNCGYVFKVYPRAETDADRTTSVWRLRLDDGSTDMIDSLRELQRRISSGELTPDNEISRGDDTWKSLGSIPELETFFRAAGGQFPSSNPASPLPRQPEPTAEPSRASSLPPGRRPRQPTLLGVMPVEVMTPLGGEDPEAGAEARPGAAVSGPGSVPEPAPEPAPMPELVSAPEPAPTPELVSAPEPVSATESYESPYPTDPGSDTAPAPVVASTPPPADVDDAEFEERPRSSLRPSTPPPGYFEDDDIPGLPGRGGSPLRWLILIVIVGGLALMFAQWPRVARLLGIDSDPALIAASLAEGDASLAEGHPKAYASAIEAYARAIEAGGDRDSEVLSRLSNAYALAAQAQIDNGVTGERIDTLTAPALMTAQSAAELQPDDLNAKLAEADALRLTGDNAEARRLLEEARSMSFSRTAEFFRIDARLSAAEAGGNLENGIRSARQSAELAPGGAPFLLLLARAEHAAEEASDARVPLETILADYPEHPVATKLLAEFQAAEALADAGVVADAAATEAATETGAETAAEADSGKAAESGAAVVAPAVTRKRAAPSKPKPSYDEYDRLAEAAGSDAFVDGRPPVRGYDWYMRQGRAELAGGNYSRARAYFDSALEARPGSAEAMDGLGKVMTHVEDYKSALRYFRVAAQRGHPDGYFNLARTYERLGRNEEAVSAYYTYVKRRPSGTHAATAIAAIKRLEPRATLPSEIEQDPKPRSERSTAPEPSPADDPAPTSEPKAP